MWMTHINIYVTLIWMTKTDLANLSWTERIYLTWSLRRHSCWRAAPPGRISLSPPPLGLVTPSPHGYCPGGRGPRTWWGRPWSPTRGPPRPASWRRHPGLCQGELPGWPQHPWYTEQFSPPLCQIFGLVTAGPSMFHTSLRFCVVMISKNSEIISKSQQW